MYARGIENIEAGHCESYWEREATVEDALLYRDLARAASPAASLYKATDDRPARSARYREFLAPQSYGDEVRASFKTGGSTWGVVDIFREQGRTPFTSTDLSFMAAVGPVIASAAELFLSAHTVRNHLKAVFAKVGVGSRGELVAKLFADHYGPALHTPDGVVHVEV